MGGCIADNSPATASPCGPGTSGMAGSGGAGNEVELPSHPEVEPARLSRLVAEVLVAGEDSLEEELCCADVDELDNIRSIVIDTWNQCSSQQRPEKTSTTAYL